MKEKVVVTGGAGFIGSHLVDALAAAGYEVHVIDNLGGNGSDNLNVGAVFHEVDVRDLAKITPIIAGAKYVFHLAALPSIPYSIEEPVVTNEHNMLGTLNVLVAARDAGVSKVIYSASSAAYGDQPVIPWVETMTASPTSPYGLQKYIGELYCRVFSATYGLPTVSLRYFNVYGPRQNANGPYAGAIIRFINLRKQGESISVTGDGSQTRDFIHVSDVVRANLMAAKTDKVGRGETINIGTGQSHKIIDIANLLGGAITFIPPRLEVKDSRADIGLARTLLGWEPKVLFRDGIVELKKLAGLV